MHSVLIEARHPSPRAPLPRVVVLAALALLGALLPGLAAGSARADSPAADAARQQHAATAAHILETVQPSGLGREWAALGLARSDVDADEWLDTYYRNLVTQVGERGGDLGPATTYARVVIALSALGKDVTDVGGHDLRSGLADMTRMRALNAAVFGLIALDTRHHQVPEVAGVADPTSRQKLVDRVLELEISGGGWAFAGSTPDPDMTGMALQALARYRDQPAVAAAVARGVATLADIQRPSGAFASYGVESAESTTQVLIALSALGIDPAGDARFAVDSGNPVTALSTFFVEGGGFWYGKPGAPNAMATEQAFYGLTDYLRFVDGKPSLYRMDVPDPAATTTVLDASTPEPGVVRLVARVAGAGAAGAVEFFERDVRVGQASVTDGTATLELRDVAPGEHTYTATFVPATSAFRPSSATAVSVRVAEVPVGPVPSTTATPGVQVLPRAVRLRTTVRADAAVTGRVRFVVRRGGNALVTRAVRVDARGVATVRVTKAALRSSLGTRPLRGRYKVVVRYLGSSEVTRSAGSRAFRL